MFVALARDENGAIRAREPANPKPWQPIGLRHDVERDTAFIDIGDLRQPPRRIALDQSIDFVAEQPDAMRSGEDKDAVSANAAEKQGRNMNKTTDTGGTVRSGRRP